MAATALPPKRDITYAISYGFLGGPAHSRKLRELLEAQGLKPAKRNQEADILIAHSAGCWLIPQNAKARLVVFVGMPLSQDKPRQVFREANWQNTLALVKDSNVLRGLTRIRFSIYYGIRQPRRNRAIIKQARNAQPNILPHACHVFIANRHDPWPRSEQLNDLAASKRWAFINFTGSHDDIWRHPDRYIPIINHYARLLA